MLMGSLSACGTLLPPADADVLGFTGTADRLRVRIRSDAVLGRLVATNDHVEGLRLPLNASYRSQPLSGATLTTEVEVGSRYARDDAETSADVMLGGCLRYALPAWRLTLSDLACGLLVHEDDAHRVGRRRLPAPEPGRAKRRRRAERGALRGRRGRQRRPRDAPRRLRRGHRSAARTRLTGRHDELGGRNAKGRGSFDFAHPAADIALWKSMHSVLQTLRVGISWRSVVRTRITRPTTEVDRTSSPPERRAPDPFRDQARMIASQRATASVGNPPQGPTRQDLA